MPRWQHAWITISPGERADHEKLEQMGNDGWELVSVLMWGTNSFVMFFKRAKE